jgi:hypothetical protein
MSLRYVPGNHSYYMDGKRVRGVTGLLSAGVPKPALPRWSAKVVAEYVADHPDIVDALRGGYRASMVAALSQAPWGKRDRAADRGTDLHALVEKVVYGNDVEVPESLADAVEGFARWADEFQVEPIWTECPVGNRKWNYAGKPDALVRIGRGPWAGRVPLLDWKTGDNVYGEVGMQTAAYACAEFRLSDPDDPNSEVPMEQADCTAVVHVQPFVTEMYPLASTPEQIAEHFSWFTHAAFLARKVDAIKELIGQPMDPDAKAVAA